MRFRSHKVRTKPEVDWIVVGLGNPGSEYNGTRHNVGAEAVEQVARAAETRLRKSKHRSLTAGLRFSGSKLLLAVPVTYMNNSGEAAKRLVDVFGVDPTERLVVVHDELDLPPGVVKLKKGGGTAGHNGLKSIQHHLKTNNFIRIRIGIDRPAPSRDVSGYVLGRPNRVEAQMVQTGVDRTGEVLETLVSGGIDQAMAKHNVRT